MTKIEESYMTVNDKSSSSHELWHYQLCNTVTEMGAVIAYDVNLLFPNWNKDSLSLHIANSFLFN